MRRCARANFTNEAGHDGTTRFLKNISGLWLLQECRRAWAKEGTEYGYEELTHLALETEPLRSLVNPNSAKLSRPEQMPRKIQEDCEAQGSPCRLRRGRSRDASWKAWH